MVASYKSPRKPASAMQGGARLNAGRKSKTLADKTTQARLAAIAEAGIVLPLDSSADQIEHFAALAKARKEMALSGINAVQLEIQSNRFLPREAFREATATLLATLSQGLRSLPDVLERRCHLSPEAVQLAQEAVDESLNHISEQLAQFVQPSHESPVY